MFTCVYEVLIGCYLAPFSVTFNFYFLKENINKQRFFYLIIEDVLFADIYGVFN